MTTLKTMLQITDDMKYLGRLNKEEFSQLLFPHSESTYVNHKWSLFQDDKLEFIWSCSVDKVKILVDFINDCEGN
jgi:hypothetical protein